jgi:hypothetical protein
MLREKGLLFLTSLWLKENTIGSNTKVSMKEESNEMPLHRND